MSSQAFFYKVWFGSYGQDAHISLSSTAHDRTPFCAHPECLIIVMLLPIRFIGVYRTLSRSERLLKNTKNHEKTRRWMVGGGRWTVDGGRWTVACGRWAVDSGRWTVEWSEYGPRRPEQKHILAPNTMSSPTDSTFVLRRRVAST